MIQETIALDKFHSKQIDTHTFAKRNFDADHVGQKSTSSRATLRRFRNEAVTQKNLLPLVSPETQKYQEILDYARHNLPQKGRLSNKDGFIYVDVDDDYIHTLFEMLGEEGFEKPPYFRRADAAGAHISVILKGEHVIPEELDLEFSFEIRRIRIVETPRHGTYAIIEVDSPELEALRAKYGLSPKVHGDHEFHITIAEIPAKKMGEQPTQKISA